jgi:membrane-associated phospholipid phosphatase
MLRTPRAALIAALACLAGLAATGVLAYLVPVAHSGDSQSLRGFSALNRPRVDGLLEDVAHLADPLPYGLLGVALVAVALMRGRRRLAGLLPVVLLGSPGTSELLKPLLAHPRPAEWLGRAQIHAASWPSGHATASMTIALCAVLVAPAVLRPLAAVGGALFALGVSFSILALLWHFPSDVVGGYLVAATWALLAVAVLRRWPQPGMRAERPHPFAALLPVAALVVLAAAAAAALAFARPALLAHVLVDRRSFAAVAGSIAALALALAGALAYGVSGARRPAPRGAPPRVRPDSPPG